MAILDLLDLSKALMTIWYVVYIYTMYMLYYTTCDMPHYLYNVLCTLLVSMSSNAAVLTASVLLVAQSRFCLQCGVCVYEYSISRAESI
jgi:hypothetical protein